MRSHWSQVALILSGLLVGALFAVFLWREAFPEYRIYQNAYVALENFRSTYTHQPPPQFKEGIKQIVLTSPSKGPEEIDRCISCHVALEYPHFSSTEVAHDAQGKIIYNADGTPSLIPNPNYVWAHLDAAIAELQNPEAIETLKSEGKIAEVKERMKQAEAYRALKTAHVEEQAYDMKKVLSMHPLIGKETRPFEFHPVDQYGCVSCHNGNGRGLTTDKAHGPVFDETYEPAFMGSKPSFLEEDPLNDPRFSHIFNDKPGHSLLFQTTPLFVGGLIDAKCVQCHKPSDQKDSYPLDSAGSHFKFKTFTQGYNLYISQGCYACHRIAGLARGGVGPELTFEGNAYPWFVKESVVWPQADLKMSTMPNYRLDHEELEAIVAFLLSQKGQSKAVSEIDYLSTMQKWEAGNKLDWEKPVSAYKIQDLHYGMTVFATEGCAACHRLKGFESNVGFAIEKSKSADFDALYKEKAWFQALFPETITGKQLVEAIDAHSEEIDTRIVDGVRENSLLEKIQNNFPGTIEAFYSHFKYASRAKNSLSADSKKEKADWKERLNRVLLMFIQEYGLGRLIGPRPNWSGVYRSDTWLMEHFRNPSAMTPRSIMPVFPFDDTKFYALTYMLDVLGRKNRDQIHAIWKHQGFNPELAYEIHCSQCHGTFREGNGPVAEWIYPIPKNLSNGEFLRNLTKAKAKESIHHGIKGTPMPPWGEAPQDKLGYDKIPVLNEEERSLLVDWLFNQLPGGTVIQEDQDVPKWHYTPSDVLRELQNEGGERKLLPHSENEKPVDDRELTAFLEAAEAAPKSGGNLLFDAIPNPLDSNAEERKAAPFLYYIKRQYYTPQNIAAGQSYFEMNCAACHGKDADGSGARAEAMYEAKPRMLTNLNWLNTRDDLRLLRSIKYGVPGTAMTPWGDQTSSLQRIQLVMFIRTLSEQAEQRAKLLEEIYKLYDQSVQAIELARNETAENLEKSRTAYQKLIQKMQETNNEVAKGSLSSEKAIEVYTNELKAMAQLQKFEIADGKYNELKTSILKTKALMFGLGASILSNPDAASLNDTFLEALHAGSHVFAFEKKALKIVQNPDKDGRSRLENEMLKVLNEKISTLGKHHESSKEQAQAQALAKLRDRLTSDFKQLAELEQQQTELFKER